MTTFIGILFFIAIAIIAVKIIGYVLMAGGIVLVINTLKNRSVYTKKRVAASIIVAIFVFIVGSFVTVSNSELKKSNINAKDNGIETVQSIEDNNDSFPIIPVVEPDTKGIEKDEPPEKESDSTRDAKDDNIISAITLETATVTKHVDGDTVYVELEDGKEYKLRMIGVDTPETVHPSKPVEFFGKEASDFTKSTLLGKTVYLEKDVSETDRYDRLLRYMWLEQPAEINEDEIKSKMFNAILVTNGYAQVSTYPPDVKYQDYFIAFANDAREKEIGLWSESNDIDTVKSQINTSSTTGTSTSTSSGSNIEDKSEPNKTYNYVGNSNTMKFHYTSCSSAKKISENNRVYFETRDEAISCGYIPCKRCNP